MTNETQPILTEWVGQHVSVVLRTTVPTTVTGKLLRIPDDLSWVLLELPHGETFVPMTSILHISLKS